MQCCPDVAQKGWLLEGASSSVPLPRVAYKGEWPVAPVGIPGTATRREGQCAVLRTVAQFNILSPLHLPPQGLAPVAEPPADEGWAPGGPGARAAMWPSQASCLPSLLLPPSLDPSSLPGHSLVSLLVPWSSLLSKRNDACPGWSCPGGGGAGEFRCSLSPSRPRSHLPAQFPVPPSAPGAGPRGWR